MALVETPSTSGIPQRRVAAHLLLVLALVCGFDAAARSPDGSAALLAEIKRQIGEAECDNDAQCRTIAIGHKVCGGPLAYLPWSVKSTSQADLESLAARHREAQRRENARSDVMSNCVFVADPGAVCVPQTTGTQDHRMVCVAGGGAGRATLR